MTRTVAITLATSLAVALTACNAAGLDWDEVDYCPDDAGCSTCDSDDDCVSFATGPSLILPMPYPTSKHQLTEVLF